MPAPDTSSGLQRRRLFAYLLLVIAAASWGVNWAVARSMSQEVTPAAPVFWR